MENINWLITGLTFLGGIYIYVKHTRRLNKQQDLLNRQNERLNIQQRQLNDQQQQINKYQLQKNKAEEIESKQAFIEANVYKTFDSNGKPVWRMKIFNKGKSKATNIEYKSETLDADEGIKLSGDPKMFPIPSLLPQGSVELVVLLLCRHEPMHNIKFTWDDESGIGRHQEQDVVFNVY